MQIKEYKRSVFGTSDCLSYMYKECFNCQSSRNLRALGGDGPMPSLPTQFVICTERRTEHYRRSISVKTMFEKSGRGSLTQRLHDYETVYGDDYEAVYKIAMSKKFI